MKLEWNLDWRADLIAYQSIVKGHLNGEPPALKRTQTYENTVIVADDSAQSWTQDAWLALFAKQARHVWDRCHGKEDAKAYTRGPLMPVQPTKQEDL